MTVTQLAESASFVANKVNLDTTKTLGDTAQGNRKLDADSTFTVTTDSGSAQITVKPGNTIYDVLNSFNTSIDTSTKKSLGLQASYDKNLQQFILKTKGTGQTTKIQFSGTQTNLDAFSKTLGIGTNATVTGDTAIGTGGTSISITSGSNDLTINIGGISSTITIPAGTSYTGQTLAQEINNQIVNNPTLASKVNTVYDNNTGKMVFTSSETGTTIQLSGGALSSIGFSTNPSIKVSGAIVSGSTANGKNADITFNGTRVTTLSTNDVTFMGVNYSLKDKVTDATITVSRNLDSEVKSIKDFIDKYNDILDKLNKAIDEPVYKDYLPLTDEQRKSLSDKQIEQWELKAKSGLLHRDGILSSVVNNMRNMMTSTVDNGSKYNSLSSIGIKSNNYQDKGKLYVDEDKLRAALQADPDAVKNLFTQSSETDGKNGLINRMYDDLSDQIKKLTNKAGVTGNSQMDQSVIGKLLRNTNTRMIAMEDQLQRKEDAYYRQFTAMEKAMSNLNSQSSWLMQQFSGGNQ